MTAPDAMIEELIGLNDADQARIVSRLTPSRRLELATRWSVYAHAGQTVADNDWTVWLIQAGRGFGKTRAGAQWVYGGERRGQGGGGAGRRDHRRGDGGTVQLPQGARDARDGGQAGGIGAFAGVRRANLANASGLANVGPSIPTLSYPGGGRGPAGKAFKYVTNVPQLGPGLRRGTGAAVSQRSPFAGLMLRERVRRRIERAFRSRAALTPLPASTRPLPCKGQVCASLSPWQGIG